MTASTASLGNRVDANLKRALDATAEKLGLTPASALTVFTKRFAEESCFPFAVRKRTPTEAEYAAEMLGPRVTRPCVPPPRRR